VKPASRCGAANGGDRPDSDSQGARNWYRVAVTVAAQRYTASTMAETTHDPRVDAYIESLPDWQRDICRSVRALVHAADPEVTETIKRTDQPYFVLQGNICALLAAKDHVNVFLYDPLVPDPAGVITSGHENKTGRTVAIHRGEAIHEEALVAMFRAIIAHNRAGGWRKIMREQ
jgi:hypothetical protein